MIGIIRLSERERKIVLKVYRGTGDARTARRAHLLLLLASGYSWRDIMAQTFCSSSLIRSVSQSMRTGGVEAVLGRVERRPVVVAWWLLTVLRWLQTQTPRDFGFFRWRWTCGLLALLLWQRHRFRVSGETVRRALHEQGFVWRRPRPVVGPSDPEYDAKLQAIRRLLKNLNPSETAVFQDEVDVHLNPKIGSQWMKRGQQAEVRTPGNNEKRHLSGSLDWRTGRLYVSAAHLRRNAQLFVDHLEDLRRRRRRYRVIHVICDNARFHDCRLVRQYLAQHSGRFELHFLPKYAPETNQSSVFGGTSTKPSPATTAARICHNCSTKFMIIWKPTITTISKCAACLIKPHSAATNEQQYLMFSRDFVCFVQQLHQVVDGLVVVRLPTSTLKGSTIWR